MLYVGLFQKFLDLPVTYFTGWRDPRVVCLQSDHPLGWEGVMTWASDGKWIVIHSTLATLLILSWAYIPA
jgi:hypothetical protein